MTLTHHGNGCYALQCVQPRPQLHLPCVCCRVKTEERVKLINPAVGRNALVVPDTKDTSAIVSVQKLSLVT